MHASRSIWVGLLVPLTFVIAGPAPAQQQQPKPNILVIMGDDIGYWNISAYNRGMMGYHTPNIDRIANEGHTGSCSARSSTAVRWLPEGRSIETPPQPTTRLA